jgi:hypothetical protein
MYFGNTSLDTINYCTTPLTYLTPQIQNTTGIVTDTLNWIPITGTFTAIGDEKYLVLGNFNAPALTNTLLINTPTLSFMTNDIYIDDVSIIELDIPAYAGPDKPCITGDSVFIGREPDFAIDPGCIWYKLSNMTTAIDTISGLWVKPTATSTYVVRQELDCSSVKWDTVVVFMDAVGIPDISRYSDHINLFPNPTSDNITISVSMANPDIRGFSLVNNLGQTIREGDLNLKDKSFTLQTSDLDPGIYQVHFKTSTGTVTKQFVKN